MKRQRLLVTLGILLLASIAAVWILLPDIVGKIVTQRLQAQGFRDVDIDIVSVSSDGIQVDYLSLMLADNSWRVRAADADIGFRLNEIFAGDVQTIDIGRLALERQDDNSNGAYVGAGAIIALLSESWHERLSVTSIRIQDLVIRDRRADRQIDINARVGIQKVADGVRGDLEILGRNDIQRAIQFQWLAAKGLHVAMTPLKTTGESPAILDLAVVKDQKAEFLTGHVRGDLEQLGRWVQPFLPKSPLIDAAGVMEASIELWPSNHGASSDFSMSGTAENLAVADTQVASAKIDVKGVFRQSDNGLDLELHSGSAGEFQSVVFTDTSIDQLRLMAVGTLHAGPEVITLARGPGTLLEVHGLARPGLSVARAKVDGAGEVEIRQGKTTGRTAKGSTLEIDELHSQHVQLASGKFDVHGRINVERRVMQLDLAPSDWFATEVSALGVHAGTVKMNINGRYIKDAQGVRVEMDDHNQISAQTIRGDNWSVGGADMEVTGTLNVTDENIQWLENTTSVIFNNASVLDYSAVQGKINWRGSAAFRDGVADVELLSSTSLDLTDIRSQQFQAATLSWPLHGKIQSDSDAIAIKLHPDSVANLTKINAADIKIKDGKFSPIEQNALRITKDKLKWRVVSGDWNADMPPFAWGQSPLNLSPATVSFDLAGDPNTPWRMTAHAVADRLETEALDKRFVLSSIDARISGDNQHLSTVVNFSPHPRLAPFHTAVDYQFDSEKTEIQFRSGEIDLAKTNTPLSVFLEPWPYEFDLASGQIRVNGHAKWSRANGGLGPSMAMTIDLDNAGGFYREVLFSGLKTEMSLDLLPTVQSLRSAEVNVAQVDFGLSVTNARGFLSLDASTFGSLPRITMRNVGAEFLGGRVSSREIEFDLNRETNEFEFEIHELNLEEIMRLQEFEGLKATGRLSGNIPITVRSDGVHIEKGKISALSPGGQIHYAPAEGTGSVEQAAPGTEIVFQALKDFRYDVLSADTRYSPDGELSLQMHLEGRSPELKTKRPVHLNINLEQNVLSFLKSLRFVDGLSDELDKRVREHYKATRQ